MVTAQQDTQRTQDEKSPTKKSFALVHRRSCLQPPFIDFDHRGRRICGTQVGLVQGILGVMGYWRKTKWVSI